MKNKYYIAVVKVKNLRCEKIYLGTRNKTSNLKKLK